MTMDDLETDLKASRIMSQDTSVMASTPRYRWMKALSLSVALSFSQPSMVSLSCVPVPSPESSEWSSTCNWILIERAAESLCVLLLLTGSPGWNPVSSLSTSHTFCLSVCT